MDPQLLTAAAFWNSPEPHARGPLPPLPALGGHVLFETSGTTGTPKWVALSKSALLASAAAVNRHLEISPDSVWGLALPVHHVGGFGVAARSFEAGCRMAVFAGRWDPQKFTGWLAAEGVTHTSLVPTQVHDLVRAGLRAPAGLRAIVVGGGRLELAEGRAARALGWPVLASYGMSEAGSQIATQPLSALAHPYTPSPIAVLPHWLTRADDTGRLEISGPALFSGYLIGAEFQARPADWHATSDRVELTPAGLVPLGRADALVKVLGELVDPEAIERELAALSQGALATGSFAVAAVPDARAENRLIPVFDSSCRDNAIAATLALYQTSAPGFRRLGPPLRVEALPRTELGKLRRGPLAEICRGS